jgi:hypothetical protein
MHPGRHMRTSWIDGTLSCTSLVCVGYSKSGCCFCADNTWRPRTSFVLPPLVTPAVPHPRPLANIIHHYSFQ